MFFLLYCGGTFRLHGLGHRLDACCRRLFWAEVRGCGGAGGKRQGSGLLFGSDVVLKLVALGHSRVMLGKRR